MKTVLIVEDEKLIRQGLRKMIQRSGVPVEVIMECNNGETALEILKEQSIDVMFTDIRMPKMDGIELVERMQECEHIPLTVAISGYTEAAPSLSKHKAAPLSFALFGGNTALYRKRLKAVHLKNRVKQPRADSGISEDIRRATASMNGGVFMLVTWQSLALPIYGGLLTGSRKACRYLMGGYSTPESDPRPSSGIERW